MRALPAARVVDAVADAASRWCDADFPLRVRATRALVARTGYTEPVVEYALDRLFQSIDRRTLEDTIAGEIGSLAALDGFVPRHGRPDAFFRGVDRAAIVSSDTTIGVAIPFLAFALCAKTERIVVKDRDDALVAAFAETLVEERPEFAIAVDVQTWAGDDPANATRFADADTVVAFGRNETLVRIRSGLAPHARFVGFGHRTSVGYVARDVLADAVDAQSAARGAALDALLYDGEGCLSLHALFVERGGALEVDAFARLIAEACDDVAIEFPAGFDAPDAEAAAYRRRVTFREAQGLGSLVTAVRAPHAVVLDPPRDEPPPMLRRTLAVYGVDSPSDALIFVRSSGLALEAVALAGAPREDIEAFATACGASRIARLGRSQDPPLAGEHGGSGRILPFVRAIYRE